jgi:hypothetical protein
LPARQRAIVALRKESMSEIKPTNRMFEQLAFEILEAERMTEKEHIAFFRGAKKMFEGLRQKLEAENNPSSILNAGLVPNCPFFNFTQTVCSLPKKINCPRCHGAGCYEMQYLKREREKSNIPVAERANCPPEAGPTNKPLPDASLNLENCG